MITKYQAKLVDHFEHAFEKNADGTPLRARRNGVTKLWKTRPDDFKIPAKHGLRNTFYITQDNAHEWYAAESFDVYVKRISLKDLILSMVDGLRNPATDEVAMSWFGMVEDDTCFGCAATNAICKISGVKFNKDNIASRYTRSAALNSNSETFLNEFENSIDALRVGSFWRFNLGMDACGMKQCTLTKETSVTPEWYSLPPLTTYYTEEELIIWEKFANNLK